MTFYIALDAYKKSSVPDLTFESSSPAVATEPEYAIYDDAHRSHAKNIPHLLGYKTPSVPRSLFLYEEWNS
ncbi:unnamed protein product [Notodromas monacha]|uniref:Uncharacterized protein n=1 Tax=Notodromas monacha TaxID=399045 RepID=A0A7R9G9C5_9CRUS|nr:unnamed protein product [Notodromas monacha]CAG0912709.1 unnamed protein product [Notodromas monacha]